MILIGTCDDSTQDIWLDCIAEWHDFCVTQTLEPWEHLTTQAGLFYISNELYNRRQGHNLRSQMMTAS